MRSRYQQGGSCGQFETHRIQQGGSCEQFETHRN